MANVGSCIQYKLDSSKIWETTRNKIASKHSNDKVYNQVEKGKPQLIQQFSEKDVFYLIADKGNQVVTLDKADFYERINTLLNNGVYIIFQNKK